MTVRCLLTGHRWWRSQTGVRDCARCPAWQWLDATGRWRRGRDRRLRGLVYHARTTRIPQRVIGLPGGRMLLVCRDRPRLRIRRRRPPYEDPDYSRAYQDEYQRLWHEAAAERDALREALRRIEEGTP